LVVVLVEHLTPQQQHHQKDVPVEVVQVVIVVMVAMAHQLHLLLNLPLVVLEVVVQVERPILRVVEEEV
jgi:hypothetical protein